MKVLVTGGAGFIGSHIVHLLVKEGHQVVVLDDLSTGLVDHIHPHAAFVRMDVRSSAVADLFRREMFDAVIHQAAQTLVPKSLDNPHFDADVNIMGSLAILEACRLTDVGRIVFASSAAVYGDTECIPVDETAAVRPFSFYGLSKLTVEKYLALYHELYGLKYAALRYSNVYGERQGEGGEGGVVSIFTRLLRTGSSLTVFGNGEQTRDFIYAGDVAAANVAALSTDCPSGVYNISTQSETSVNQLILHLAHVSGCEPQVVYQPAREGDIYRSSLANGKAVAKLGWQPRMPLANGLARTYQSLIQK